MRRSNLADAGRFDAVIAFDNAVPHLDRDDDVVATAAAARRALRPGGVFLASIRDYDQLLVERPRFDPPRVLGHGPEERIVLQLWTWLDDRRYRLEHMVLSREDSHWDTRVRVGAYRAILREELTRLFEQAGFRDVRWRLPSEGGFYQPIIRAVR